MPQFWEMLPDDATPQERRLHKARFNRWVRDERTRVLLQRAILAGQTRGVCRRLIQGMLGRAWELLDAGDAEAADALLEFVPEEQATALLDEFFEEE
ncbi:MAG TPA: hypothetical protein VIJ94_11415 [Caulobacteraceae bacterium]